MRSLSPIKPNCETVKLIINDPSITGATAQRTKDSLLFRSGGRADACEALNLRAICCAKQ